MLTKIGPEVDGIRNAVGNAGDVRLANGQRPVTNRPALGDRTLAAHGMPWQDS